MENNLKSWTEANKKCFPHLLQGIVEAQQTKSSLSEKTAKITSAGTAQAIKNLSSAGTSKCKTRKSKSRKRKVEDDDDWEWTCELDYPKMRFWKIKKQRT